MPLSRRALLLAAAAPSVGRAAGLTPTRAGAGTQLVWTDGAVARWRPGSSPLPLPATPAAAPVATAAGVWLATAEARLQRWTADDGWQRRTEVALPAPAHALAASADGQAVIVACAEALLLFDADGLPLRRYEGSDLQRRRHGRAESLHALSHRRSLVAAWPTLGEWWEISLDPDAPPVFDGLVHDYRMGEAIARPGFLGVRRMPFDGAVPWPAFAPAGLPWVAARAGPDTVAVVHLDVRRSVASLHAPGARVEGSALHGGRWWLPVGPALWGLDPRRWIRLETRAAPGSVRSLAVAGGELWALVGRTLYRHADADWVPVAEGIAAIASGPGAMPLAAPPPWQGVAALR